MNRKDWRKASVDQLRVDAIELRNQLLPTLRTSTMPGHQELAAWAEYLVTECRDLRVLPLASEEREFIGPLNDRGARRSLLPPTKPCSRPCASIQPCGGRR